MRSAPVLAAIAALLVTPPVTAAPRTHVVVIDAMKFGPIPAARVGDRIKWVNKDMFRHTATARDAGFDLDLPAGASGITTVKRAGAFAVTCRYHPGMRATLKVAK